MSDKYDAEKARVDHLAKRLDDAAPAVARALTGGKSDKLSIRERELVARKIANDHERKKR